MVPLANSARIALSFLFQRIKWPVPMVRWRTAKEIRDLLNDPVTRPSTTEVLLDYLDHRETESEVCEILTIVLLTLPIARPTHEALTSRIHHPSILTDIILQRIYGTGRGIGGWGQAHSGRAPADFEGGSYFEEHKTAHVPPVLTSNLAKLERVSGHLFLQHWAYEWKVLSERLGTHYTRYPHYFDDVLEARAGIMGQYWQRMRDVYLSAYLRTLAYAVSEWRMPQPTAEGYCIEIAHGIAGLFDVEPMTKPTWLSRYAEPFCATGAELEPLVRDLIQDARDSGMTLVSLNTPVASSMKKYARFTLSAHLVTDDYKLPDNALLYERMLPLLIGDSFELKGPPADVTVEEANSNGEAGNEVSVCSSLFPIPFGTWQSDYISIGLPIPANYTASGTEIRCTRKSIDLVASDGKLISRTSIWNDDWTPQYPRGGSTQCAVATMIDVETLAAAETRLSRRIAWFAKLRTWDRETQYGDYQESEQTAFFYE